MKWMLIGLAGLLLFLTTWAALFPDTHDTKNLHYILWKHHLAAMNMDKAAENLIIDPDRDSLLLGKTKAQVAQRYGFLRSPQEVRPYLRDYCWAARPGSDAMFVRNLDFMIVFKNGRATEVLVCKG